MLRIIDGELGFLIVAWQSQTALKGFFYGT